MQTPKLLDRIARIVVYVYMLVQCNCSVQITVKHSVHCEGFKYNILLPDLESNQGCNCQNAESALTQSRMNEHEGVGDK